MLYRAIIGLPVAACASTGYQPVLSELFLLVCAESTGYQPVLYEHCLRAISVATVATGYPPVLLLSEFETNMLLIGINSLLLSECY